MVVSRIGGEVEETRRFEVRNAVLIASDRDFDSLAWRLCNVNIVRCTYLLMQSSLQCSDEWFTRAIRLSHDVFGSVGPN
jgi:hypothetical protein